MLPNMNVANAAEAIAALAGLMEEKGFVSNAEKLVESALEREAILGTGMDNGMAFPHVRGVEGGGLTMALGTVKKDLVFDDEGTKVRIVFFMTIPTAVSAFYLRLMSGLTESLLKEANRESLLTADSPALLWKAITKATRYTVK